MTQETVLEEKVEFVELEVGEVPKHWRDVPYRILQHAITFGLIIPDYTLREYIEHAVETGGYETIEVWGVQGSGKSSRLLQQGYWVYEDWDKVLENVVMLADAKDTPAFKDRGFLQKIKEIPYGKRKPWLGWDDITVHMPSTTWRTDIQKYEAIDATWAAIRTKINVVSVSNPVIDRLAKNIKDNLTFEVFIGRNQLELIERHVRLVGLKTVECNFFKIQVEPLHKFNLYDVPKDVFKEYWELRLQLADYAIQKLGVAYGEEEQIEGMVAAGEIVKKFHVSPLTVYDMIHRGGARGRKIGGLLYVNKEDYETILKPFYEEKMRRQKRKRRKTN